MLRIDRQFIEHYFRYDIVLESVYTKLNTLYGISDTETPDLYQYLAGKDAFADSSLPVIDANGQHLDEKTSPSREELESLISEWKDSKQAGKETPLCYFDEKLLNNLSEILGEGVFVEKESEQQRMTRQAIADTEEKAGLLYAMSIRIMSFYYKMLLWREKKLYRSKWLDAFDTLKTKRKSLTRVSRLMAYFERNNTWIPPEFYDILERRYNKDYRTFDLGRFLQLLYGQGFVFNEVDPSERNFAFQWLQSIYLFANNHDDNEEIVTLLYYLQEVIKIPYYERHIKIVHDTIILASSKRLSDEIVEDDGNDEIIQGGMAAKSSKVGEKHDGGTWHTDNNTTSDLVWTERFSKCWKKLKSLIIEKIVFPNKFNTGRKKERAISMLEASMLYKVLESNGLARSFWEHGTTSSFVKTLPQEADIYRQGLGSYIFLIEIIQRIEELKQENSFYKDTKRTTSGTGLKGGGDKVNWKRGKQEQLLLTQNPKDLIMELELNYPDIADFLTVKFENHESILSIMNEISNYSWCKNPSR